MKPEVKFSLISFSQSSYTQVNFPYLHPNEIKEAFFDMLKLVAIIEFKDSRGRISIEWNPDTKDWIIL